VNAIPTSRVGPDRPGSEEPAAGRGEDSAGRGEGQAFRACV